MSFKELNEPSGSLVGKFVLTPINKSGPSGHQGQVVDSLEHGRFCLVQWFSWVSGDPTNQKLYSITSMCEWEWTFFDEQADWIHAGREQTFGKKFRRPGAGDDNFCSDHGPFNSSTGCRDCIHDRR